MNEIVLIVAVLAGAGAAGTAMYFQGRRTERRIAEAAAKAAEAIGARMLIEARERATLETREELVRSRELVDEEVRQRRAELDRREGNTERREQAVEARAQELESRAAHQRSRARPRIGSLNA